MFSLKQLISSSQRVTTINLILIKFPERVSQQGIDVGLFIIYDHYICTLFIVANN